MSKWATTQALVEVRDATGNTRRVVQYDALIVGTARANGVDCLVTYDHDIKALAQKADVMTREPSHFRADPTLFG